MPASPLRREWLTLDELRERAADYKGLLSIRAYADQLGVDFQPLHTFLSGGKPGKNIPAALGYEAVTLYRPIHAEKEKAPQ